MQLQHEGASSDGNRQEVLQHQEAISGDNRLEVLHHQGATFSASGRSAQHKGVNIRQHRMPVY
ncbi:MAG: hypothetical protein ACQEXQ_21595 [Bacillota bacterium]